MNVIAASDAVDELINYFIRIANLAILKLLTLKILHVAFARYHICGVSLIS